VAYELRGSSNTVKVVWETVAGCRSGRAEAALSELSSSAQLDLGRSGSRLSAGLCGFGLF